MTPNTIAERLGVFAETAMTTGVPDDVRETVLQRILDTVGVALAASGEEAVAVARNVALSWGGHHESTVMGFGDCLPAAATALVNGTLAHALDFDDTHLPSVLHPSASVVPAALAVAEQVGASGEQLIRVIAVGNELACRIGMGSYDAGLKNSIMFEHGLHATSICGTLAAAATGVLLMGGAATDVTNALGVAASMGAGLIEANRTGGTVKRMHCGWAAHAGIVAAQMTMAGLTGPPTVFEGRFGFFEAYSDGRFDEEAVVGNLGSRWEIRRLFTKAYPTNHFTQAGIDAALEARRQGIDPDQITSIELGISAPTIRTIGEPLAEKTQPQSGYHAKFSGPYTIAVALLGGGGLGVSQADFTDDVVRSAAHQRLASLVTVVEDKEATATFPHQFPAVLRIGLRDGSSWEHRVRHNRGGPENPLSRAELETKFRLNAEPLLGETGAQHLASTIWALPESKDVTSLLKATVGPRYLGHAEA